MSSTSRTVTAAHTRARSPRIALVLLATISMVTFGYSAKAGATPPPNVIVILTDDQPVDLVRSMPNVWRRVGGKGVRFTRAFVSNPLCCPSRTSILTGTYSHTNRVYSNDGDHGGMRQFVDEGNEALSMAVPLQEAGYRTGFVGKFLNGFASTVAPDYRPPGWERFVAIYENVGGYYNYDLAVDGELRQFGSERGDYSTDVLTRQALRFVRRDVQRPFFLFLSYFAPHTRAIPAPRHVGDLSGMEPYRSPAINEANVSDKPDYIRAQPRRSLGQLDQQNRLRAEALLSVDEGVGKLLDLLQRQGQLQDTVIVFLSDNGVGGGEHRWTYKLVPYERSIQTPLVIRYDRITSDLRRPQDRHLVLNVDLAPTIYDLTGTSAPGRIDGQSLVPLLRGRAADWRSSFLIESLQFLRKGVPTYCGIRTKRWKYVKYDDGFLELYDLRNDPHELDNAAGERQRVVERLHTKMVALCDPPPPGYAP
jgi:N-acetylglucosamine-6-sulfatase